MLTIRYIPAQASNSIHTYFIEPNDELVQAYWTELKKTRGKFGKIYVLEADLLSGGKVIGEKVLYYDVVDHWPVSEPKPKSPKTTPDMLIAEQESGDKDEFLEGVRDTLVSDKTETKPKAKAATKDTKKK